MRELARIPRCIETRKRRPLSTHIHPRQLRPNIIAHEIRQRSIINRERLRESLVNSNRRLPTRNDLIRATICTISGRVEVAGDDDRRAVGCVRVGAPEDERGAELALSVGLVIQVSIHVNKVFACGFDREAGVGCDAD